MNATQERSGCVVVGIDGGYRCRAVLAVAAGEARRRGTPLALINVSRPDRDPDHTPQGQRHEEARNALAGEQVLAAAAEQARADHPDLEILTVHAPETDLDERLPAVLGEAALLVLGTRGADGRLAFGLDSVSWALLRTARSPVLGVPDPHTADDPEPVDSVVVGVGGPRDAEVVAAAVAEAGATDRIEIVHAYHPWPDEPADQALHRAWEAVAAAAAAAGDAPGGVTVTLTPGDPVPALLRHAARARVLVAGTRGPGALAGLARDSVSHRLLRDVSRPVLVVPRGVRTTA